MRCIQLLTINLLPFIFYSILETILLQFIGETQVNTIRCCQKVLDLVCWPDLPNKVILPPKETHQEVILAVIQQMHDPLPINPVPDIKLDHPLAQSKLHNQLKGIHVVQTIIRIVLHQNELLIISNQYLISQATHHLQNLSIDQVRDDQLRPKK